PAWRPGGVTPGFRGAAFEPPRPLTEAEALDEEELASGPEDLGNSSNSSMQTIRNFRPSSHRAPRDGLKTYIYNGLPGGELQFKVNILNPTISSCTLNASV